MDIVYVNKDNYQKEINKEKITLMVFYADWCGPCKAYHPNLEKIAAKGKKILKINADENSEILEKYGLGSIPASIMYRNGEPAEIVGGYLGIAQLEEWFAVHDEPTFDEKSLSEL
jgi:thioredoxin 1